MKSNVARAPSVFCYAKSTYPLAVTWSSRAFSIASLPILPVLGEIVRKKQFSIVFYFTNLPEGGTVQTDVRKRPPLCKGRWRGEAVTEGLFGGESTFFGTTPPPHIRSAPPLTQGRQCADGCWWEGGRYAAGASPRPTTCRRMFDGKVARAMRVTEGLFQREVACVCKKCKLYFTFYRK